MYMFIVLSFTCLCMSFTLMFSLVIFICIWVDLKSRQCNRGVQSCKVHDSQCLAWVDVKWIHYGGLQLLVVHICFKCCFYELKIRIQHFAPVADGTNLSQVSLVLATKNNKTVEFESRPLGKLACLVVSLVLVSIASLALCCVQIGLATEYVI